MEAPLLLPISTGASSSSSGSTAVSSYPSAGSIAARYLAVLAVAAVSLFAQHEASKGFRIDVLSTGAAAGRRFDLLFVSNGRAERLLHRASRAVEQQLFPDASFPRRRVARVAVRLMEGRNLTAADATVDAIAAAAARGDQFQYVISLNPGLLFPGAGAGDGDVRAAVAKAVRRAVARMWLWDGRGAAPAHVTDSMVEYLAAMAGGAEVEPSSLSSSPSPAEEEQHGGASPRAHCVFSARLVKHLEEQGRGGGGFVARLNRAMRDRWSDAAVDAALGAPARPVCEAFLAAGEDEARRRRTTTGR